MRASLLLLLLVATPAAASSLCDAEHFASHEASFDSWSRQQLEPAQLGKDLRRVVQESRALVADFTAIAAAGCGERSVNAALLAGRVDAELARLLSEAPAPKGLSPDQVDLYRAELAARAAPLLERARETFEKALARAVAEHVTGRHVDAARRWLDEHRG